MKAAIAAASRVPFLQFDHERSTHHEVAVKYIYGTERSTPTRYCPDVKSSLWLQQDRDRPSPRSQEEIPGSRVFVRGAFRGLNQLQAHRVPEEEAQTARSLHPSPLLMAVVHLPTGHP